MHDGEWGTVCDDEWENFALNSKVACRSLGLDNARDKTHEHIMKFGGGSGKTHLDNIRCTGLE